LAPSQTQKGRVVFDALFNLENEGVAARLIGMKVREDRAPAGSLARVLMLVAHNPNQNQN
jgi:hypothetical protein